ncbi:MAG: 3'-5' exoribonuclease [Bacteroidales bacterium]|nr:3'-5' exoribonuclease [Bacteroidales bacterium]
MQNFAAIDFEGANRNYTSACSVGVVVVRNGAIVHTFYSLIHPEPNYYEWYNTKVHGLRKKDTQDAPKFPEVWACIRPYLELSAQESQMLGFERLPLVAHGKNYDENVLRSLFRMYKIKYPNYKFLCTFEQARKVWPEGPHTLVACAERCGSPIAKHHHALADAEACAAIALQIL